MDEGLTNLTLYKCLIDCAQCRDDTMECKIDEKCYYACTSFNGIDEETARDYLELHKELEATREREVKEFLRRLGLKT